MDEALNLTSTSLEENSRQTCDMGLNPSRARHHPWHPALQAALHLRGPGCIYVLHGAPDALSPYALKPRTEFISGKYQLFISIKLL